MTDVDTCKKQLDDIVDGDSTAPRADAYQAGRRFCKALSAGDLGALKADLAGELAVRRRALVPTQHLATHSRRLAALEGALRGIEGGAKAP